MPLVGAPSSPFDPPSLLYTILTQPVKTLIRFLDNFLSTLRSQPPPLDRDHPIRIVCLSDTHTVKASHVPDGDLLIHAGDLTDLGNPTELQAHINWLNSLPHEHKIAIAGNHDTWCDARSRVTLSQHDRKRKLDWGNIHYLQHSTITLDFPQHNGRRLTIYGAPQIPACGGKEFAFQYPRGTDAWSETIPQDIDILVTHTPPKYHLDLPAALGCEHLLKEVWNIKPRLHAFGHIHAGRTDFLGWLKGGREVVRWDHGQKCLERTTTRSDGLVTGLIDPRGWLDAFWVMYYGIIGVLWDRIWGGESDNTTLMVNAALMYNNTGKLGNEPQVIVL